MSADLAQLEISPRSYQPTGPHPPMRFLGILALLIFSAEIITMVVLFFLPTPNYFVTTLLDGSIMLALILPGLYFLQLKPLLQQIEERNRAQDGLRASENLLRKSLESLWYRWGRALADAGRKPAFAYPDEHIDPYLYSYPDSGFPTDTHVYADDSTLASEALGASRWLSNCSHLARIGK